MSNIIHSQSQALDALQSRSPSRSIRRSTLKRVQAEAEEALVAATRVEGTAYITSMAATHVGILSTIESQIVSTVPASDPIHKEQVARRVAMLVDNYTATAAATIAKRGY